MMITTFGELMLRLTATENQRFTQASNFKANFGGAEANVAVLLSRLGDRTAFVTKLPNNALASAAIAELKGFGIDTSLITRGGNRMGIYFVETGSDHRGSNVIYDRIGSSFATSVFKDFDWDFLLMRTSYFYISGISAALSPELRRTLLWTANYCHQHNIKVIYDANFRGKLWSPASAQAFNSQLMPSVDICLANDVDLKPAFGLSIDPSQATADEIEQTLRQIPKAFPNCQQVASIFRKPAGPSTQKWFATLLDHHQFFTSQTYETTAHHEIGAGDAFGGAMTHGILNGFTPQYRLDYALAAAILKLSIAGDYPLITDSDIQALLTKDNPPTVNR